MDKERLAKNTTLLKRAVFSQIGLLVVGIVCFITGILMAPSSPTAGNWIARIGMLAVLSSVIPYLFAIVLAYVVQDQLRREGLYPHGAWQLIVAAPILNPFIAGWWPPLSTYLTARGYLVPVDQGFSLGLK